MERYIDTKLKIKSMKGLIHATKTKEWVEATCNIATNSQYCCSLTQHESTCCQRGYQHWSIALLQGPAHRCRHGLIHHALLTLEMTIM